MRTTFAFSSLLAACSIVLAGSPTEATPSLSESGTDHTSKEYIITFMRNETISKPLMDYIKKLELPGDGAEVKFMSTSSYTKVIIIDMCDEQAKRIEGLGEVAYVEEKADVQSFVQKTGSPWGLQEISSSAGATGSPEEQDFTYTFSEESLGAGVDIYVIDTGVRTSHAVFTGRGTQGFTATGSTTDGDGHGTHVAGTAGGAKFGVAQGANIIAVKVLGDDGAGSSSDTIAGMDWVITNHEKRRTEPGFKGSIMSMSWGLQGTANAVDEVIIGALQAGIHVSVAAGNDGVDACGSTPAHLGGANSNVVTVGSININNEVSSFSNIGQCVDIFAPGEQILSSWSTGDDVINFLSGTSMACPHATGVMATLIAQDPTTYGQNPAALKAKLLETARQGKVTGNLGGSANLLLSNGANGEAARRLVKNYVVPDHSLTGSPAARAANSVKTEKKWELHSRESLLRF